MRKISSEILGKCILGTRFSPMVQPSTRTEWFGRRPSQWLQRRRGPVQDKDILMAEMEQNWWNVWTYNKFWADRVLVGVLAGALNLHERGSESSKVSTEQSVMYSCPGVMCISSEQLLQHCGIQHACPSQILYLSKPTKITTNTETALPSMWHWAEWKKEKHGRSWIWCSSLI